MDSHLKILLVEDNDADVSLIREMLRDAGPEMFELERADRLEAGLLRISEKKYDALLLDLGLPDSQGIAAIEKILTESPEIPVIVLTGLADEKTGVEAVHKGAQDYLVKGSVNGDLLIRSIRYSIERKRLMTELHNLSLLDDLTGLYNRRGFFALAEQQMRLARRETKNIVVVIADLDGLKLINDSLGHVVGDMALKDASSALKETFRESDIIGRIGGDEFAVSMIEELPAGNDVVIARLRKALKEFSEQADRPFILSLSIGIARCEPESVCSIDDLLREADKLMYEDKSSKKKPRGY